MLNVSALTPSALCRRMKPSVGSASRVEAFGKHNRNTGTRNIPESNKNAQRTLRCRSEHIHEKQGRHGHTRRLDLGLSQTAVGPIALGQQRVGGRRTLVAALKYAILARI